MGILIKRMTMAASLLLVGATMAVAQPVQQTNATALWFEKWDGLSNATLTVVGANGKIYTAFAQKGTPVFQVKGKDLENGRYIYELSAATGKMIKIVNEVNNGRGDKQRGERAEAFTMGGSFTVYRGSIMAEEDVPPEEEIKK